MLNNSKTMKDWKFLYTPRAGIVRKSTHKELKDFRDSLTKKAAHDVIAFTPGYNHNGPQFPYFQCLYPNYNKNWAYGLNKKKGITKTRDLLAHFIPEIIKFVKFELKVVK